MDNNVIKEEAALNSSNANNTLYWTFKDEHPCSLFIQHAIVKLFFVLFGFFFNFALLYVTIRSSSLRGTANYLLALNSFIEILHQYGHLMPIYVAFSGANFLAYPLGIRINTPAIFGLFAAGPSLFCTGIDRLFAVTLVKFYQNVNKVVYLLVMTAFCFAYAAYVTFLAYTTFGQFAKYQITGNMADLLQGEASATHYQYSFILNISTVAIYIMVGIIIRFRSDQSAMRIYRSLFCIIFISVGGYLTMRFYTTFLIPNVQWSQVTIWSVRQYLTIPMNVSAGSNAPILFITSADYRKAFRKEWRRFVALLRRHKLMGEEKNRVHVIGQKDTLFIRKSTSTLNARLC